MKQNTPTATPTIAAFRTRTGLVHRRISDKCYNALVCNSGGSTLGFRGTPFVATREQLNGRKLCAKCFPVQS